MSKSSYGNPYRGDQGKHLSRMLPKLGQLQLTVTFPNRSKEGNQKYRQSHHWTLNGILDHSSWPNNHTGSSYRTSSCESASVPFSKRHFRHLWQQAVSADQKAKHKEHAVQRSPSENSQANRPDVYTQIL